MYNMKMLVERQDSRSYVTYLPSSFAQSIENLSTFLNNPTTINKLADMRRQKDQFAYAIERDGKSILWDFGVEMETRVKYGFSVTHFYTYLGLEPIPFWYPNGDQGEVILTQLPPRSPSRPLHTVYLHVSSVSDPLHSLAIELKTETYGNRAWQTRDISVSGLHELEQILASLRDYCIVTGRESHIAERMDIESFGLRSYYPHREYRRTEKVVPSPQYL